MNRHAIRTLVAATALTAFATPAYAQDITRIYAFGDSYADTGNAFAYGYANPQARQTYPTGRFSGGSNYIDTLAQLTGAPVTNYAIGGALGGMNNTLICFDPVYGAPLCGKGFRFEADRYAAAGSGANTRNDLIAVSIGGNDARLFQQSGGTTATAAAAATQTAALTTATLNQIVGTGTPTISFLAGNTALLPEIAASPSAQQVRNIYSNTFNAAMRQTLAGYAAKGSVVHYLDLTAVLANIAAKPSLYGLSSVGPCPAAQATNCVSSATFADQYLFYVDALHLSSQGFRVVGRYVAAQLDAPRTLGGATDTAMAGASGFGRVLSNRSDLGSPRDGDMPEGVQLWATGDMYQLSAPDDGASQDHKVDGHRATIGAEVGFGMGSVGIAVAKGRGKYAYGTNAAHGRDGTTDVGLYGSVGIAGGFAQAYGLVGRDNHDLMRDGVELPMSASADGTHKAAGAKIGFLANAFGTRIGPVAAIDYASAKIDAYSETGDTALNLNVREMRGRWTRGSLGLEMRGDVLAAGLTLRPYLGVAVEKNLSSTRRTATFSQATSPEIVNNYDLGHYSKGAYGRLTAGLRTGKVGPLMISGALSMTSGRDDGDESTAQVGISLPF